MSSKKEQSQVLKSLSSLHTIRERAHRLLRLAKQDKLPYFTIHEEKMISTASFISKVIAKNYPTLEIPYHSRWRHFEVNGINRVHHMLSQVPNLSPLEQGKILYELVIISVFLDAGAGGKWSYFETSSSKSYTRSEGLAIASFDMYQKGVFSSDPTYPYRIEAQKLIDFTEDSLNQAFQVTLEKPLEGVKGRVSLLNRLGHLIRNEVLYFGEQARLGDFYLYIFSLTKEHNLSAQTLFEAVLAGFRSIWPVRLTYEGISLGDVWVHNSLKTSDPGSELMPFHKLSQWLTYSLLEPLEQSGIKIINVDQLTGLPEYRNGGLLIDTGLLSLKNEALQYQAHAPHSELIVEWRALTIAILDELAELVQQQLGMNAKTLSLAQILQGGTWDAGRQIAKQKRKNGTPPLQIISDGTVF